MWYTTIVKYVFSIDSRSAWSFFGCVTYKILPRRTIPNIVFNMICEGFFVYGQRTPV